MISLLAHAFDALERAYIRFSIVAEDFLERVFDKVDDIQDKRNER